MESGAACPWMENTDEPVSEASEDTLRSRVTLVVPGTGRRSLCYMTVFLCVFKPQEQH